MAKQHDHLEPSEEEPYRGLSLFNFLVSGSLLMFYLSRFPLDVFRRLCNFLLYGFVSLTIVMLIFTLEKKEKEKNKIISPTPTNMEFSDPLLEQEPCYTQSSEEEMVILFNVLMIGSILLFYLRLLFPLGLFSGLCNFLLVGFFSLTIMMIFIFADDPKQEVSCLLSNRIDKDKRKPGDHIYTRRGGYAHHGICARDGNVIHFARGAGQGYDDSYGTEIGLDPFISNSSPSHSKDNPMKPCTSCGDQSNLRGVISSCIECFLYGGDLYLFQYFVTPALFFAKVRGGTCTHVPSDPPEVVLNRAEVLLYTTDGFGVYHILRNNCESFASYCHTGLPFFSGQVLSSLIAAFLLACQLGPVNTRSAGLAVAEGFTAYCVFRYITERGSSSDQSLKAPVERLRLWMLWDIGVIILMTMTIPSSYADTYYSL